MLKGFQVTLENDGGRDLIHQGFILPVFLFHAAIDHGLKCHFGSKALVRFHDLYCGKFILQLIPELLYPGNDVGHFVIQMFGNADHDGIYLFFREKGFDIAKRIFRFLRAQAEGKYFAFIGDGKTGTLGSVIDGEDLWQC